MGKGFKALALGALLVTPLLAEAALVDRGGGLIYDTTLNITWLQDANYAKTSGYDSDGRMRWPSAKAWADSLSFGGYDDWRLPSALNRDGSGPCGTVSPWGCDDSELGYMFYKNMGATKYHSILSGSNTANLALFSNLEANGIGGYWFGTEYEPVPTDAWVFWTENGYQQAYDKDGGHYSWAVRDGDVVPAVPLPAAGWLLLSGLAGLGFLGRRRKH